MTRANEVCGEREAGVEAGVNRFELVETNLNVEKSGGWTGFRSIELRVHGSLLVALALVR